MWNKRKYWFRVNQVIWGGVLSALPVRAAFFSSGDENTRGPSILKQDVGVRALGLGGSAVGVVEDPSALYWNPAGIQMAPQQEVQFMHAAIFSDQTNDFLGYLRPYWRRGERETLGLAVSHLAHGQFDVVDDAQSAGTANPSETVVGVSFARPLRSGAWGLTGKWVRQDLFDQRGDSFALDAGYQATRRGWGYGIVLSNLGPALSLGEVKTELPLVIRAGLARKSLRVVRGEMTVAVQAEVPADDRPRGRLGLEWACPFAEYWRGAVRSGYRSDGSRFTLGAGLAHRGVEFNYAFAMNGELGATNLFDLTFRFGPLVAEEIKREELVTAARKALDQGQYSQTSQHLENLEHLSPRDHRLMELRAQLNQSLAETIDPDLLWKQGQEAQAAKKWETAALLYRKLLIVQPDSSEGAKVLKEVEKEIELTRAAAAQEAVRKARAKELQGVANQAREAAARKDWPTAVKAWKRVIREEGSRGRHYQDSVDCMALVYDVARKAEDGGQIDLAVTLYQSLSENPGPYQDSAQRSAQLLERAAAERGVRGQSIYEEGLRAYREGNLEKARALFEQARELAPHNRGIQKALERLNAGKSKEK